MSYGFFGFPSFNIEQKIDSNALKLLAREGNTTQYAACRLTTVGDQMQLKEIASELPLALSKHRKKPSITEMKSLTELNQRSLQSKVSICHISRLSVRYLLHILHLSASSVLPAICRMHAQQATKITLCKIS